MAQPQAQTDPWVEAAKNFKADPQSGAAPASGGNDDWKIWQQQGGDDATQDDGPIASFDRKFVEPQMAPPNESMGHHAMRAASNFGGGVIGGLTAPFLHPVRTLAGMGGLVTEPVEAMIHPGQDEVSQMAKGVMEHPEESLESMAGGAVGGGVLGEGMGGMSRALAGATERGGLNLGNMALGARGPKPFKYGANPARGAFEEGVLPAMSKHSAAMKVENALPDVGSQISAKVGSGSPIPSAHIAPSIEDPIQNAGNVMSGFGGGKSLDPITNLWASMEEKAPNASGPIYGRMAPQDVPAPDLWHSIRNLDKNTRFNPDPEVEGVNELRRDIRGGLRGNLETASPGLKPLSQRYGDLKGAEESLDKTLHSGTSLRKMASVPMFPIESTIGRGMYGAGKMMANGLPQALEVGSPTAGFMSQMRKKEQ